MDGWRLDSLRPLSAQIAVRTQNQPASRLISCSIRHAQAMPCRLHCHVRGNTSTMQPCSLSLLAFAILTAIRYHSRARFRFIRTNTPATRNPTHSDPLIHTRTMVDVEEVSSEEDGMEQRPSVHSHSPGDADQLGSDYEQIEADDGDEEEEEEEEDGMPTVAKGAASTGTGSGNAFPDGFQQILQLASHLKSSQPEVREKRQRWERLAWHQKNTILFQTQDAAARYDLDGHAHDQQAESVTAAADSSATASPASSSSASSSSSAVPSRFDTVRYPLALRLKTNGSALFQAGRYSDASLSYQRAIGLFQWARKFQTKDGDEIEWHDLLSVRALPEDQPAASSTHSSSAAALEVAAASTEAFHAELTPLTAAQTRRARELVFTCLVNVAACEERLQQWQQVVDVCEAALDMDMTDSRERERPSDAPAGGGGAGESPFHLVQLTVKALFRCATANNHLDELEKAIALLQRAAKLAPKDAHVCQELSRLRGELAAQRRREQESLGGFFGRGEVFEAENVRSAFERGPAAAAGTAASASSSGSPAVAAPEQTKEFLSQYLSGVQELARKEKESKRQQQRQEGRERRSSDSDDHDDDVDAVLDTSAPPAFPSSATAAAATAGTTSSARSSSSSSSSSAAAAAAMPPSDASLAAVYADARAKFGLDLSDPLVQEELRRLQEHHRRTGQFGLPPEPDQSAGECRPAQKSGVRSSGAAKEAIAPADLSSSGWLGPLLFSLIFAVALRWMHIL